MSSQVDKSLNYYVQKRGFSGRGGRGRGGKTIRGGRKGIGITTKELRAGIITTTGDVPTPKGDLRNTLKATMPDLRATIKATSGREKTRSSDAVKRPLKSPAIARPTSSRSSRSGRHSYSPPVVQESRPAASSNRGNRRHTASAHVTEPKKIIITVPGRLRTESEPSSRREERLHQNIMEHREHRHSMHDRYRDNYISKTFTSAMKESMYPPSSLPRAPSPRPSYNMQPPREKPTPAMYSSMSHGIATGTVLMISNLCDTVTKSDIMDLCEVCGQLASVQLLGRGVAEVVFVSKNDAEEAYRRYHKRNLDGQPMMCKLSTDTRRMGYDVPSSPKYTAGTLSDFDLPGGWFPTGSIY